MNVSTGSEHTLVVSFPAWAAGNESGSKPTGYNVQHRFSWNGHWINGVEIEHDSIIQQYRTQLENLDPDNTYYVRVIPFLNDGGIAYYGIPTSERGPFSTIAVGTFYFKTSVFHSIRDLGMCYAVFSSALFLGWKARCLDKQAAKYHGYRRGFIMKSAEIADVCLDS